MTMPPYDPYAHTPYSPPPKKKTHPVTWVIAAAVGVPSLLFLGFVVLLIMGSVGTGIVEENERREREARPKSDVSATVEFLELALSIRELDSNFEVQVGRYVKVQDRLEKQYDRGEISRQEYIRKSKPSDVKFCQSMRKYLLDTKATMDDARWPAGQKPRAELKKVYGDYSNKFKPCSEGRNLQQFYAQLENWNNKFASKEEPARAKLVKELKAWSDSCGCNAPDSDIFG